MSKKNDLISKFKEAKKKHELWISYADAIYKGEEIDEKHIPVSHVDCEFGKWMADCSNVLANIKYASKLDEKHKALHTNYMKLYKDMHEHVSSSIFNRSKMKKEHQDKLEKDIKELHTMSESLMYTIDSIISEVNAMPDAKLEGFY